MFYPEEKLEEIKDRLDVVDLIGSYVKLKKSGSGYVGLCPFHSEKTPSFSVSPGRQSFHCFGCGKGGDIFWFVKEYENISYPEAIRQLAERAGVSLPELNYSRKAKEREKKRERLFAANKEAARYFYYLLRAPAGKEGMAYLERRGLTGDTIHRFGLGFAASGRDNLVKYLKEKGFTDAEIRDAALAKYDEKWGLHDHFWNRVMFPIQDVSGRVIGFGGRVMGEGEPKYLNSQESPVFDKSRNLYGLNFARASRKKRFILCEGYMDVISQHQAGFTEAVASLGTAFTPGQAALLRKYDSDIYLAYDSDGAGTKAAIRAGEILREAGMSGKIISLKPYKDPDEFVRNLGAEEYEKRILDAENLFLFEIRSLYETIDRRDPAARTRFASETAAKLLRFEDAIERDNYLSSVASIYGIDPGALKGKVAELAGREQLKAIRAPVVTSQERAREKAKKEGTSEKLLLRRFFEEPESLDIAAQYLSPEDFTVPPTGELAALIFALGKDKLSLNNIVGELDEETGEYAAGLFSTPVEEYEREADRKKVLFEMIRAVKQHSLEKHSEDLDIGRVVEIRNVIAGLEKEIAAIE